MVLRIRLQSHQVHLTMMHIMYGNKHKIHIHKMNLSTVKMGSVRQNPIQKLAKLFKKLCNYITHN